MILQRLKRETQGHHEHIARHADLLHDVIDLSDYCALLQRFWGFYAPVEAQIATSPVWELVGLPFEQRRKTHLLERDLAALGAWSPHALPRCSELPVLGSDGRVLGCAYVLEGATLGGQLVARAMRQQHNIDAANGAAFYSSYGAALGPMWRAFGAAVAEYAARYAADDAIVDGANETFVAFDRWLVEMAQVRPTRNP
jgi:heme oxygenase (biliverdin-IX-beta and delta-forming)